MGVGNLMSGVAETVSGFEGNIRRNKELQSKIEADQSLLPQEKAELLSRLTGGESAESVEAAYNPIATKRKQSIEDRAKAVEKATQRPGRQASILSSGTFAQGSLPTGSLITKGK